MAANALQGSSNPSDGRLLARPPFGIETQPATTGGTR